MKLRHVLALLLLAATISIVRASSILPLSVDQQIRSSDAIFRGTVLAVTSFRGTNDGMIYTRTALRVDEAFNGKFPAAVNIIDRGGEVDGIGMLDDLSPRFRVGDERLLFVKRRGNGTLFALQGEAGAVRLRRGKAGALVRAQSDLLREIRALAGLLRSGGADVTDQAANVPLPNGSIIAPSGDISGPSTNGLLVDNSGVPYRYIASDRGEEIPYLVDTNFLPSGISPAQALGAVSNALSAWAAASSIRFSFLGTQNFGAASPYITNDGVIRIQLHDAYHYINSPNVLGEGGSYYPVNALLPNANWGPGGRVNGMEFNNGLGGFVVLQNTNATMQTLSTFTEVLTHEIGHVIGLAHSSNVATNDPVLTNSVMFFQVHADGRGARLNSYDTNVVREGYPLNTPPYSYSRVMDITSAPSAPQVAGINEVQLRGYDLQSTNLVLSVTNPTIFNGTFTNGSAIQYTPAGFFADSSRIDPATSGYFDQLDARYSDGTNASPYVTVRVVSFNEDDYPSPSDGIPNRWMTNYFGHGDPRGADKSRATDDKDGDKLNNLQEYIAGMVPTNAASAQRATMLDATTLQWQAKAYELYEIQGTTNLGSTNWTRIGNPIVPTNAPIEARTNLLAAPITATTSNLPAANAHMFYRVLKVP